MYSSTPNNTTTKPDFFKITSFFLGGKPTKKKTFPFLRFVWKGEYLVATRHAALTKRCELHAPKSYHWSSPQVKKTHASLVLVSLRLVGKTHAKPNTIWVFFWINMKMDGFLVSRKCSQSLIFQEHLWNISLSKVTIRNRTYHLDTVYKGYTSKNATTASLSRALGWH